MREWLLRLAAAVSAGLGSASSMCLSRIIGRVNVDDLPRADAAELEHCLASRPREMGHLRGHGTIGSRGQSLRGGRVESVPRSEIERARDDGPSLQGTSLGVYNAQVPGGVFSRSVPAPVATASGLAARDSAKTTRAATRFIGSPPIRDAPTSFRGQLATVVWVASTWRGAAQGCPQIRGIKPTRAGARDGGSARVRRQDDRRRAVRAPRP